MLLGYVLIIVCLILLPYAFKKIKEFLENEELEKNFPLFLRDLSQYLEIGQPLPVALRSVSKNDYGKILNKEIRKILTEMEFNVPFTEALERMAKRIKSEKVRRAILSLLEAEKYGGNIKDLLTNFASALEELVEIKKERISRIRNFMLAYYMVFFGFVLSIIFIIYFFKVFIKSEKSLIDEFKFTAMILTLLNALFTGLVIGKVSFGKISAGILHSVILVLVVSIIFLIIF